MSAHRSRPSKAWLAAAIALVVVGVIAALVVTRPIGPVDPETAALRAATEGALSSLYAPRPPATYDGGPLPSPIAAAMRARITSDFGRYFTARLQARYQSAFLDAVDQMGTFEWDAQGGSMFDWAEATMDGDRATVHVTEIGWVVRRGGGFGTDPTASHRLDWTDDWTVSLVRSAGEWRVDQLGLECRGGCA